MKTFDEWLNENDLSLDLDLDIDKPTQPPMVKKPMQPQQLTNEPQIKSNETSNGIEVSYSAPNVKGYLHAQQDNKNPKIYRVIRVTVEPKGQGYGKKLYIAAIQNVTKKGAMLTPAPNSTSDSAINVWKSLYADNDFKKISLSPSDWPESPRNQNMMRKYPNLRFKDPSTYPPQTDSEFWAFNSGYQAI